MANSLQEQLIKAGLADQAQARTRKSTPKPAGHTPRRAGKPKPARKPVAARSPRPRDPALEQERRELRAMEQERIRQDKQALEAAREKQQRRERVRAFLLQHQQNDRNGDIAFNFQADRRIRRLYVTAPQRDALQRGALQVAVLGKRDFLIEAALAEQVLALDAELFLYDATRITEDAPAEDDPYKDYAVPDDLMW